MTSGKKRDRSQKAVFADGPGRGIELLVVDRDDVDVREVLPFHAVEVVPADAVGAQRRDLHLQFVAARLQDT